MLQVLSHFWVHGIILLGCVEYPAVHLVLVSGDPCNAYSERMTELVTVPVKGDYNAPNGLLVIKAVIG